MTALTFKVEGRTGLIANLYGYQRELQRGILDEVKRYGTNTKVDAQIRARVDSGKMRDGIEDRYSEQGRTAQVGWDEPAFTADGDYPYFYVHELGSSTISPQPMIGPAHRRHAPIFQRNVAALMRRAAQQRSAK